MTIATAPLVSADPPSIERRLEGDDEVLALEGAWRLASLRSVAGALRGLRVAAHAAVVIDGSRLASLDTAGAFTLMNHLADVGIAPGSVRTRNLDPRHQRLLDVVRERMTPPTEQAVTTHPGLLERVGRATVRLGRLLATHTGFIGAIALELAAVVRRPSLFRPRETVSQFESVCLDAIPIVALVNFLIGVVIAYVLGVQAQRYGATLFVADGIALAVCREMSPILVSVLVAGRSGAAFTAQIGTMKVEEEIDAIATLGLSPIQVLVLPRLVALTLAMPLLVFVGDVAGIVGGLLAGTWQLDIAPGVFLARVHSALDMRHVVVGLVKAPVFAAFIALIACRMGLLVSRDARSVGANTTSTVVQCIVWVIVIDAAFAVLLQQLGI